MNCLCRDTVLWCRWKRRGWNMWRVRSLCGAVFGYGVSKTRNFARFRFATLVRLYVIYVVVKKRDHLL